jgi:Flp pilus assembly protein TadD
LGHPERARTNYLQALKFDPLNTVALNNLGLMELQLGKMDVARRYFGEVLKIKPDDPTAKQGLLRK